MTLQTTSDPIANGSILTAQNNLTTSFTAKWWLSKRPITVADQEVG